MSGTEVPGVGIDAARLSDWIAVTLGGAAAPVQITRIKGGQSNPTYLVRAAATATCCDGNLAGRWCHRRTVDREYRVMAALAASDVPVARVRAVRGRLCDRHRVLPDGVRRGRCSGTRRCPASHPPSADGCTTSSTA